MILTQCSATALPVIFGLHVLVDQTEFWSDLEDKTERLSSIEKFMQIRTETEV